MISRRGLLACGSGLAIGGLVSPARTSAAPVKTYDDAVRLTWAPFHVDGGARELIRYATLAANSHNTQPWKFKSEQRCITIAPDFARRCPAVDPEDHHLFVSLGCAAENLVVAGLAHGLRGGWIRFSDAEAVAKRDGLFSRASGSPSVPRWLAAPLFKLLFTPKDDNEKYSKFIRSSAGIAVFVSDASDKE